MSLLRISLLASIGMTATFSWINYECIEFGDTDNKNAQNTKIKFQNDLNLNNEQLLQFCEASYYLSIAFEAITCWLFYLNIRTMFAANPIAIHPENQVINAAIAPQQDYQSRTTPLGFDDGDSVISWISDASEGGVSAISSIVSQESSANDDAYSAIASIGSGGTLSSTDVSVVGALDSP